MAPILIDHRGLVKIGSLSVLTMILIFVSGFLFGHQRAATFYTSVSETASLALPEKVHSSVDDIEPQPPENIAAGEAIDVDQPDILKKSVSNTSQNSDHSTGVKQVVIAEYKEALAGKDFVDKDAVHDAGNNGEPDIKAVLFDNAGSRMASAKEYDRPLAAHENITLAANVAPSKLPTILSADELKKIKYSIQVGMYGRLNNAENMMKMLQEKYLDAYVSDHTNSKNETRYNVRFGYFTDKKVAMAALKEYKKHYNGDGYLVKFSVERVVNIAGMDDRAQSEAIKPAATSSEDTLEKISQLVLPDSPSAASQNQAAKIITN